MNTGKSLRPRNIVILLFVVVAFGLGIMWQLHNRGRDRTHGVEASKEVKKIKYVCPMHPHIIANEAGHKCAICGMDLVATEVPEEDEHDSHAHESNGVSPEGGKTNQPDGHTTVKISDKKQQLIGIKLGKVKRGKLFKTINAPGRIAFDPELYTAQSEYLESLRQWQRVKQSPLTDVRRSTDEMIKSAKIRLKVLGLSEDQISQLARKGSQSEGLLISGKGQESWVYADIFEVSLPQIKKGLSAQISANFLQGKTLAGKVISVDQVINPETRTAKVRIQLQKTDANIRPESYVNVKIFAPQGEHLSVPIEALMDTGRDTFVFVKTGIGQFEPKRVTVLLETDDQIAIADGLSEGDEVVIDGNFMLDSESRLKAVLKGGSQIDEHNL